MTEYGRIHTDGSRSGGQPVTDIPDKFIEESLRLAGVEKSREYALENVREAVYAGQKSILAHARTLMEAKAFRQEVSDAVRSLLEWPSICSQSIITSKLAPFIVPQPDPDEELAREVDASITHDGLSSWELVLAGIKAARERQSKELPAAIARRAFTAAGGA